MYIYVTEAFKDLTCGAMRPAGTVLEVADERGAEIVRAGFGQQVAVISTVEVPAEPEVKEDDSAAKSPAKKTTGGK